MQRLAVVNKRVARGERRGRSPLLFCWKLEKSVLIREKNVLVVVTYGLNVSFKMQFLRASRRKKNADSFPRSSCSCWRGRKVYQKALIPQKRPCSKIFMVTHQKFLLISSTNLKLSLDVNWSTLKTTGIHMSAFTYSTLSKDRVGRFLGHSPKPIKWKMGVYFQNLEFNIQIG